MCILFLFCAANGVINDNDSQEYRRRPQLHSTPPLRGSYRNIATKFGMEKLEWFGYPTVKNFEDTLIHFDIIHERDERTDGHCLTA